MVMSTFYDPEVFPYHQDTIFRLTGVKPTHPFECEPIIKAWYEQAETTMTEGELWAHCLKVFTGDHPLPKESWWQRLWRR